jgi:hypothetical protein
MDMTNWTKHELGWIDNLTGLIWHNEYKVSISHFEAEAWAEKQGYKLPTQEEFEEAEKHGIRELEDMNWKNLWFWSSSLGPGNSDFACGFDGGSGFADGYGNRNVSYYNVAARAVSRPGVTVDSPLVSLAEPNSEALKRIQSLVNQIQEELDNLKK